MADVELDPHVRHELAGAAEVTVQAALSRQHVGGAVVGHGAGAALTGQTLAGDVAAGFVLELQGTVVTEQGVHAQSREEQSCGQQDGGQEPVWPRGRSDGDPHTHRKDTQ